MEKLIIFTDHLKAKESCLCQLGATRAQPCDLTIILLWVMKGKQTHLFSIQFILKIIFPGNFFISGWCWFKVVMLII